MLTKNAKSAALSYLASNTTPETDAVGAAFLRAMRIGFEQGLAEGYEGGTKAAACISVDFDAFSKEKLQWNHDGTKALLELSEKHGIPLTWAICGKTADDDPKAFDSILNSSAHQEIGLHTYSHIWADRTTKEEFEDDIRRCIEKLALASPPTSFVFPKNREGHFDVLERLGIKAYRGARKVIGAPAKNQSLWNIRPVYYVDLKSLGSSGLIMKFLDTCIARSAVFHLWTHPWSVVIDGKASKMMTETLEPVFDHLEEKSRAGLLSVTTMGALSRYLDSCRTTVN